jgi:hypothetical protein
MKPTSILAAEANGCYHNITTRKFEKIEEELVTP